MEMGEVRRTFSRNPLQDRRNLNHAVYETDSILGGTHAMLVDMIL